MEGALNLQDRKMTDRNFRGWKLQDWKLTDKSVAGNNVEHVVLALKNHHTKLINVHDLGVSVSSSQSR